MAEQRDHDPGTGDIDARLSRLKAATERVPLPAGLPDRVMRALLAAPPPRKPRLAEVIVLSSRRALAIAAVAAAASVAFSFQMTRSLEAVAAESALDDGLDPALFAVGDVSADLDEEVAP